MIWNHFNETATVLSRRLRWNEIDNPRDIWHFVSHIDLPTPKWKKTSFASIPAESIASARSGVGPAQLLDGRKKKCNATRRPLHVSATGSAVGGEWENLSVGSEQGGAGIPFLTDGISSPTSAVSNFFTYFYRQGNEFWTIRGVPGTARLMWSETAQRFREKQTKSRRKDFV